MQTWREVHSFPGDRDCCADSSGMAAPCSANPLVPASAPRPVDNADTLAHSHQASVEQRTPRTASSWVEIVRKDTELALAELALRIAWDSERRHVRGCIGHANNPVPDRIDRRAYNFARGIEQRKELPAGCKAASPAAHKDRTVLASLN